MIPAHPNHHEKTQFLYSFYSSFELFKLEKKRGINKLIQYWVTVDFDAGIWLLSGPALPWWYISSGRA